MQLSNDEITRLSPQDRLSLIGQLWDSLDAAHVPLTAAQKAELDRRLETFERDKHKAVSWEQVRAKMEKRCP